MWCGLLLLFLMIIDFATVDGDGDGDGFAIQKMLSSNSKEQQNKKCEERHHFSIDVTKWWKRLSLKDKWDLFTFRTWIMNEKLIEPVFVLLFLSFALKWLFGLWVSRCFLFRKLFLLLILRRQRSFIVVKVPNATKFTLVAQIKSCTDFQVFHVILCELQHDVIRMSAQFVKT